MPLPAYLTTAEAAEYLRLKERKVYDLVSQGVIPGQGAIQCLPAGWRQC